MAKQQTARKQRTSKRKPERLTDQLRRELRQSELTRYRIWQLTGVDQAVLCRFLNGSQGLSAPSIDALAECLGLELVKRDEKAGE